MLPKSSNLGGVTRGLLVAKRLRSPSRMWRELALPLIVTLGALLTAPFETQMITADKQASSSPAPSRGSGGALSPVPAFKPPSLQRALQPPQNRRSPSPSPQLGFPPPENGRAPSPSLQLGFQPSQNGRGLSPPPQLGFSTSQNGRAPSPSPSLQLGFQLSQNGRGPSPSPRLGFQPSQNGTAPSPSPELGLPSPLRPPPLAVAPFPAFPPGPPTLSNAQIQEIIFFLRERNYFTVAEFAGLYLPLVEPPCTLFVPPDRAFGLIGPPFNLTQLFMNSILSYHTVPQHQIEFKELLRLPVDAVLPTLNQDNTILITAVLENDYRVDNIQITDHDICVSLDMLLEISCHGVADILNVTVWGSLTSSSIMPGPMSSRATKKYSPVRRAVFSMMLLTMGCAATLVV